jgi:hypothetical protein
MDCTEHKGIQLIPRLIRLRDAPHYLGMDRNRFNAEVRPFLTEIPIGTQGVAFDRLDLDAWVDQYKSRNGRPGQPKGDQLWDVKKRQALSDAVSTGISTKGRSTRRKGDFAKALEKLNSKKRRRI